MRVLHRCGRCRHSVPAADSVSVILAPQQGMTRKGDKKGQTQNTMFLFTTCHLELPSNNYLVLLFCF